MRVRALMAGYYGDMLRKTGDVFDLEPYEIKDKKTKKTVVVPSEDQFSHEWMERVDGGPVPSVKRVMPSDIVPPPPPPSILKPLSKPTLGGQAMPDPAGPASADPTGSETPTGKQEVI